MELPESRREIGLDRVPIGADIPGMNNDAIAAADNLYSNAIMGMVGLRAAALGEAAVRCVRAGYVFDAYFYATAAAHEAFNLVPGLRGAR